MKLMQYLKDNDITNVKFAETCGVTPVTVCRWIYEHHVPDKNSLTRIHDATGGEVTPNSFYGIE